MSQTIIPHLEFSENAQFYQINEGGTISTALITRLFRTVSKDKLGNYLLNLTNQSSTETPEVTYHICCFKVQQLPTFVISPIGPNWIEQKIAYLLIIHVEDFLCIIKRNISNLNDLLDKCTPLQYEIITSLFVCDDTQFEKLSLSGTNIADNAIREKQYEASDLKQSYSLYGANNYVLNRLRMSNSNKKVAVSSSTARISSLGNKNRIEGILSWCLTTVQKIKAFSPQENYLSSFAQPLNFENERDRLIPIAILFSLNRIKNDYESGRIRSSFYQTKTLADTVERKNFNLVEYLDKAIKSFTVSSTDNDKRFKVDTTLDDGLMLQINTKTISLKAGKLKNVIVNFDNGTQQDLVTYLNLYSGFIINFEHADFVYTNRKLFQDHRLLSSIPYFLKIFKTYDDLEIVTSEKGEFLEPNTEFSMNSLFHFVESTFINDYDFLLLDDLGREWADHIGLAGNKISFFHSKTNDAQFSATAFQDIIGQVQKNLGNMKPQDFQLESKKAIWSENYVSSSGVRTSIKRLRKGDNIDNVVTHFKELRHHPNLVQEVYLVVNFLSKSTLAENLEKLKNGEAFASRNETIQLLWYISSLISSCKEIGVDVFVICKP